MPIIGYGISLVSDLPMACSAFTHVTACMLAKSPVATLYTRGFGDFVTSITAPIATGCSDSFRMGFAPNEDRHLFTAHSKLDLKALYGEGTGLPVF